MDIIFATNNAHKLTEVQAVLGPGYKLLTPRDCGVTEEIPEEQDTLEGNASQKAHYLHERSKSKRWAGPRAYTRHATPPTGTTSRPTTGCC